MEPMFCKRCGKPVTAGSQQCEACGAPLTPQHGPDMANGQTLPEQASSPMGTTGIPPVGGPPHQPRKKPTKRQLTVVGIVVVAVITVIALIVGVTTWRHAQDGTSSATASATQSSSATASPRKSSTPKPTVSATPQVSSVTMTSVMCNGRATDVRWNWTGGAMASNPLACYSDSNLANGILTFGLWTPAMTQSKQFTVTLAESGEQLESMGSDFIQIAATYGDKPDVYLIYEIRTKAVGTTPESVHAYVSQLNVETGKLGKRIDLNTASGNESNGEQDYGYNFIASSDIAIAIDKSWTTQSAGPDGNNVYTNHHQVLRIHDSEMMVLQTFEQAEDQEPSIDVTASGADDLYLSGTRLFSIEDNKQIGTLSCILNSDSYSCGGYSTIRKLSDTYYAYSTGFTGSYIFNASDGTVRQMENVLGIEPKDSVLYTDNVAAWEQCSDGSLYIWMSSKRVFTMDPDLKVTEVLNGDQWSRLLDGYGNGLEGVNYLNKTLYARTTDERIVVDAQGQTVGRYTAHPSGSSNYGTSPDPTATKWILWFVGDTPAVTKGQEPGSSTSSSSSSASGSSDTSNTSSPSGTGGSGSGSSSTGTSSGSSSD
ncbi:zinc ribbon domain-containing protein [Bifidobacterium callimiconis]|uniref:Zinc-ribbon domain-containing protein n=1 Tax=Bifidobacterium callimiconis TaxID=2306973 RepID=A0A430FIJ3_9BIFI|nr:zinc ribbon domain-containing protein [Bifidobacterium callimiconis]RSX52620.1 hypothetical protein D2E23_0348 [Bifidobacterium callimiconis]